MVYCGAVRSAILATAWLLVWNQAYISITISEIFNIYMILIRPLKGQGHSLWYQSISHIRLSYDDMMI